MSDERPATAPARGGWDDDEMFDRADPADVPGQLKAERISRVVYGVEAAVLLVLAVAGIVLGEGTFLGLALTVPHAILLLVTALVVGGAVGFGSARAVRRVLFVQTVLYLFLAAFGLAFAPTFLGLNGLDSLLHAVLFLLGFVGAYLFAANILEPGEPGSSPSQP